MASYFHQSYTILSFRVVPNCLQLPAKVHYKGLFFVPCGAVTREPRSGAAGRTRNAGKVIFADFWASSIFLSRQHVSQCRFQKMQGSRLRSAGENMEAYESRSGLNWISLMIKKYIYILYLQFHNQIYTHPGLCKGVKAISSTCATKSHSSGGKKLFWLLAGKHWTPRTLTDT